ncbi:flagellar FliL protein [Ameyamaea chiangmaiensis NBRC 103196]|uniref:Flagellar protein FliL n=1 Tax=Ameyamaea chiangmaiensis TaxID=442969 RepID=A0A850P9I6_9PROT|nr:flagellar basal body-associated FliL family protein [Ameyamaea chiangmaiensis]MBS4075132.1 flagellar basal body-associated FliL family protein [Ameyamaea chiangmaiensis]NVN40694.1 flagellar basal body-associated FliL family protein [Ameyamaea chiangmaiensis]GBQ66188.1 flagellar FliL protein [Ameyamaea chiangmaiensis NBRC 103196]
MADSEEPGSPAAPKKNRRRVLMLVAVVLLGVVAGGGTYAWKRWKPAGGGHHSTTTRMGPPVLVSIPTIISNLDTGGQRVEFVKLNATIEVNSPDDAQAVNDAMPRIQDAFQTYLHAARADELQGAGLYRLKEALFGRLNVLMAPVPLRNLYFVQLLVQ